MRLTGMKKRLSCFSIENGNDSLSIQLGAMKSSPLQGEVGGVFEK